MAESSPRKVFTEQQMTKYRRIFNLFDINKNGLIEAQELAAMAKVMGYQFGKEGVLVREFNLVKDELCNQ